MIKKLGILLSLFSLASCSYLQNKQNVHDTMCSQIKNRILMIGATANPLKADAQQADRAQLDKTYKQEGC